jgi:hypothetical protein
MYMMRIYERSRPRQPRETGPSFVPPPSLLLTAETEQGILLTPYDPVTEKALAIAARAAKRYRNALRALAK